MADPIIRELRVRAVRVPMREPHRSASGIITESPLVLIDLATSDGVTGHSVLFTYTVAALGPVAQLVQNLEPLVKGEALAPLEIESKLNARFRLLGTQGLLGMAMAGIDMASWDALARTNGKSLIGLLGGKPKPIALTAPSLSTVLPAPRVPRRNGHAEDSRVLKRRSVMPRRVKIWWLFMLCDRLWATMSRLWWTTTSR